MLKCSTHRQITTGKDRRIPTHYGDPRIPPGLTFRMLPARINSPSLLEGEGVGARGHRIEGILPSMCRFRSWLSMALTSPDWIVDSV